MFVKHYAPPPLWKQNWKLDIIDCYVFVNTVANTNLCERLKSLLSSWCKGNKVRKSYFSFKVTMPLTLVSFERASLVEYAYQIWSNYLLRYQPAATKSEKGVFSSKVKVNVTRLLTLVSFERASSVEYAYQIWNIDVCKTLKPPSPTYKE